MGQHIGFVGLGNMGLPIAMRLIAAGHAVTAFDVRDDARARIVERGGHWASSPEGVASRASIVFVSLPKPSAVESVALGPKGLVHGDQIEVFIDLSTSGPQAAKRVAAELGKHGIAALDAPVSGGVLGAEKGTLSVMVSGPKQAYAKVVPLLQCLGKNVFFVGEEAGMGQVMKLINNLLSATALGASCEALAFGVKAGLNPEVMLQVLNASSGRNSATESKIPQAVLPRTFDVGFSLDLSYKDVALCIEAAEALNVPMWIGNVTRQIWHHALCTGGAQQDMSDVARCFEDWAGVEIKAVPSPDAAA
jgi:3-hydroxyisobutyrate dehydrogenase-like beta-hydroxyacid dehydrogenase